MNNQNVDQNEIAKFEALASRWWDPPTSEFKPLHDINPLRLNYIDERVSLAGKRLWTLAAAAVCCPKAWHFGGAPMLPVSTWAKRHCRWPSSMAWSPA